MGRRTLALAIAVAGMAAVLQPTLIARLPWPGSAAPDLAALVVVGLALALGARAGAIVGFGVGLTLDLMPPAGHALGQWAFVLCLLGYLAGLCAAEARSSAGITIAVGSVIAAMAPLAFTVMGAALSDPRADLGAAIRALPAVTAWTLAVAVLVLPALRRSAHGRPDAAATVELLAPVGIRS